jgi:site-specific recombinase XerD
MSIHKVSRKSGTSYQVKSRTPDGVQYSKTFRTRKEAMEYQSNEVATRARGTWLDNRSGEITFQELAQRWLDSNQSKRQTSRKRDIGILNKHLFPALGNCKIRTIKRTDINTLVNTWVAAQLSPATIRRHMAVIAGIFNMAIADDLLHKSPTYKVTTPRVNPSLGRALRPAEAEMLLQTIHVDYYALVFILLTTGIRWSEAAGLQIKHFNPMANPPTLTIEQGLHETGNGFVFESPKSAASHRVITLSPKHVEVIARYLLKTNRTGAEGEEPLFISQRGGPLVSSNFRNRIWQPAIKDAGLDGLKIKDLRKTAATNLLQSGADVKTVTAVMGHEDIRTTLNHYAKTTPESLATAAQALVDGVALNLEAQEKFG